MARSRVSPLQAKKSVTLNLMKLQDKTFDIEKNIFNISIGEITSKEVYLSNLH